VISFAMACVGGLANALLALPATAGTNFWTAIGPPGTHNLCCPPFAVVPSSPSTIYAVDGTAIMKTTDGGGHWAEVAEDSNKFDFLLVDPASPATIYAIGGPYRFIYKSIDGGVSWALLAASNGLSPLIEALAIAPSLTTTLYAGSLGVGVLKSIDGGMSWVRVNNGLPGLGSPLAIDPTNADVVYAVSGRGVVKTTNGGGQWRRLPISFPAGAYVEAFAIDPTTPSNVYAAYAVFNDNDALIQSGVFKSLDSGETWVAAQNPAG
jgi:photosystem II stability/assembly factor-like uncharacterized protein